MPVIPAKKTNKYWTGITISNEKLLVVSITSGNEGKPQVLHFSEHRLVGTSLVAILISLRKKLDRKITKNSFLLTQPEYKVIITEMPVADKNDIKLAIKWKLQEQVDYSLENSVIDIALVPVKEDGVKQNQAVYTFNCSKEQSLKYAKEFNTAKLELNAIDVLEMAQRNISALLEPENRAVAMLTLDDSSGLLTITYKGELYLARKTDVGLLQLDSEDSKIKNIAYEKITLELQRTFDHFERQYRDISLGELLIQDYEKDELLNYLSKSIYIKLKTINLEELIDFTKTPELKNSNNQRLFIHTIGAALRAGD